MSLNEVWEAAAGSPFRPIVSKDTQSLVAFTLLFIGGSSSAKYLGNGMLRFFSFCVDRAIWPE